MHHPDIICSHASQIVPKVTLKLEKNIFIRVMQLKGK